MRATLLRDSFSQHQEVQGPVVCVNRASLSASKSIVIVRRNRPKANFICENDLLQIMCMFLEVVSCDGWPRVVCRVAIILGPVWL